MYNSLRLLTLLAVAFLTFSCEDDDTISDDTMMPMTLDSIDFGGVNLTDVNGSPLNNGDPTDWQLTDTWTEQELSLFGGDEVDLCDSVENYQAFSAFPNPATSDPIMLFLLADSADIQLRLVDRTYTVLRQVNIEDTFGPGLNSFILRLDDLNITDTIRIYYKIKEADCELRGHGDLIIQ